MDKETPPFFYNPGGVCEVKNRARLDSLEPDHDRKQRRGLVGAKVGPPERSFAAGSVIQAETDAV